MKKLILISLSLVTASALTIGSSFVYAQDASATTSATTDSSSADAKKFQDRKDKILERINDRIAKMQEIQSCVQGAEDLKTLRACKPHKDKKDHGKDKGSKTE